MSSNIAQSIFTSLSCSINCTTIRGKKSKRLKAKAYRLYDINGNFLVDCGTNSRAVRVQKLLKEGKINLDMVMTVFSSKDEKKKVTANKATNDDFNWDNVHVESAD